MSWIETEDSSEDIVINSSVRLYRNIKNQKFTDKSSLIIARENIDSIHGVVINELKDENFKLIKLWEHEYNYARSFVDKRIISKKLLDRKEKSAVLINDSDTISLMINEEEHIVLNCILGGLNLKEEYEIINRIDDIIEEKVRYEFHKKLGYITTSTSMIGTAMKAQVVLHLPALKMKNALEKIAYNLGNQGIAINIMYDNKSKDYSSIYILSNKITLGIKEEEIINNVENAVSYLIEQESMARQDLLNNNKYELEDRIYRAEAILKNARLIDSNEILELLSDVRLGVDMCMINMDKNKINKMLIYTRDCMLENNIGYNSDIEKKRIERARVIKEILNS